MKSTHKDGLSALIRNNLLVPYRLIDIPNAFDHQWGSLSAQTVETFRFGGLVVNLEFAGNVLQRVITDALRHLSIKPSASADLTIRIWDSSEQLQLPPQLDWDKVYAKGYRGYQQDGYFFHYHAQIGALSFLDSHKSIAYYITRNAMGLPWWVKGSPLQVILSAWMRSRGLQLTHVAAVGNDKHCILLAGKGGSGKTTTSLDCLLSGLNFLGEDYCLLRPGNPPTVFSVYQSAKWTPQTRRLHPGFEALIANRDAPTGDKSLLFYKDTFKNQLIESLPAIAVLSLSVGKQQKPQLNQTDISTSLKNLSFTTIKQLPFFDPLTLNLLRHFCADLTKIGSSILPDQASSGTDQADKSKSGQYTLELGQNRQANVELIVDLLSRGRQ